MIKVCKQCKKEYKIPKYRETESNYCSKECRQEGKKVKTIKNTCLKCGKEFELKNYQINVSHKGKYCSQQCYYDSHKQPENIVCECGKTFKAYASRISYYNKIYCSRKCYLKYGYVSRLTDKIPIASSEYEIFARSLRSTAKYLHWKKECLVRDNFQCKCGEKKRVTVHHKVSILDFIIKHGLDRDKIEADPLFYNIDNGVTKCKSCHLKEHINKGIDNVKSS